jgi:hypothetical protein
MSKNNNTTEHSELTVVERNHGIIRPLNLKRLYRVLDYQCESRNAAQTKVIMGNIEGELPKGSFVEFDKLGNMYVTIGKADLYPTVVAHVDQVHRTKPDFKIFTSGSWVFAMDLTTMKQCGTGGDDKCGIFTALECAHAIPAIKLAFFVDEEVGCLGSGGCDMDFFKDSAFIMQADRHIATPYEIITQTNGVTSSSDEFLRALVGISPSDKWQEGSGTCTDVGELASRGAGVACVNLAAGYVRQHGSDEVISLGGLAETTEIMLRACETLATKKWEHLATSLYSNFGWTKGRVISSETPSYKGGSKDRAMVFAHYPAQEKISALAARQGLSSTWSKTDYAMRIRVMNMVALGYRLGECLFSDIDMLERVLEHELPKGTSNPRVRNNACLLCFDWNAYTTEKAKSPLAAPVFNETPKKAGKTKEPKKAGKGGRSSHLRTGLRFRGGDFPLLECRELFEACGWGRQWAGISVYKRQLYTLLVAAELSSAELEPALHDSVLDLELSVLDLYRSHGNVVDISSMTGFDFSYSALMEREIEFPGPDEPDELEMTDMDTLMSRAMERDDELDELGGWSY